MLSGSHSVCVSNDILTFSNLYGAIKAEILFKYCSLLDLLLDHQNELLDLVLAKARLGL